MLKNSLFFDNEDHKTNQSAIMPELPEVETIANDLRKAGLAGRTIVGAKIYWDRTIAGQTPAEFLKKIKQRSILAIGRRGKFLTFSLSGGEILFVHLRMTGRFTLEKKPGALGSHERITLELDNDEVLKYHDTRKFGRWFLVSDTESVVGNLGPEPLDPAFTLSDFKQILSKKTRRIKPLLLDQSFLAGLGNIYVDEALWLARLHPNKLSNTISNKETAALYDAIKAVLKKGIEAQGTSLGKGKSNYHRPSGTRGQHQEILNVYKRTGLPCPRCGTAIVRIIVAQRSTHICPHCQKSNCP